MSNSKNRIVAEFNRSSRSMPNGDNAEPCKGLEVSIAPR
jgi:hypothetical protein